ncbi:hypothetical protein [Streptomyces sp. KN37]|uniref:hypothetical protein n=1 Tax=Streptomyces sp. KN37 TaxID=3090667 RepID=UPI002A75BDDA|nr:hypothetical protein [Streptomyces sp. KN37]WPO69932.1 hypothetical protein R9806_04445 [Streptomyces sp. KN37]
MSLSKLKPVHCAPCLYALLTGHGDEPHPCQLLTSLAVDDDRIVILARPMDCLCRCPRTEESPALKAARAQARGTGAGGAP